MIEKFIEKGTDYPLRHGKLSLYETNCPCKDIRFYFDQYVLTIMLSGHKTIESEHLKFEFFPGTFFIPEKDVVNNVSIPNASVYNPTKCLVLELNPSFIQSVYTSIFYSEQDRHLLFTDRPDASEHYFLSNDKLLIQAFTRLYSLQFEDQSDCKGPVEELILREILLRVFQTEGLYLLKRSFEQSIEDDKIRQVISHIRHHIRQKLTTASLARVAGMGQTSFFKAFRENTGQSPIDFVMHERIRQSKVLIRKGRLTFQEVAFACGFNSYEYFCSSFKRIEGERPRDFRKREALTI
ncbi:MAG: helix-turn-helix domain-containing protein [Bacteroidota bacterium]